MCTWRQGQQGLEVPPNVPLDLETHLIGYPAKKAWFYHKEATNHAYVLFLLKCEMNCSIQNIVKFCSHAGSWNTCSRHNFNGYSTNQPWSCHKESSFFAVLQNSPGPIVGRYKIMLFIQSLILFDQLYCYGHWCIVLATCSCNGIRRNTGKPYFSSKTYCEGCKEDYTEEKSMMHCTLENDAFAWPQFEPWHSTVSRDFLFV